MKNIIIIFLLLESFNSYSQSGNNYRGKARGMYAFIFCNTLDKKIGPACYHDLIQITHELDKIAEAANFNLYAHTFVEKDFTKKAVDSIVSKITLGQDDIAIFYFSTHGYKSKYDSSDFPTLVLPNNDRVHTYAMYNDLVRNLHLDNKSNVGNNLLLTIIDACNRPIDAKQKPSLSYKKFRKEVGKEGFNEVDLHKFITKEIRQGSYQKIFDPFVFTLGEAASYFSLFRKNPYAVIMTSSSPGEYSYANNSKMYIGSTFTKAFVNALEEQIHHSTATDSPWAAILNATRVKIKEKQTPILEQMPIRYRAFTYKIDFDELRVILNVKQAPDILHKKDSVGYRVSLINVCTDYHFSNNWIELVGLMKSVRYYIYDKVGANSYSKVPRKIWSYEKKTQFETTFFASKEFKIKAVIDQSGHDVVINISQFPGK